MTDMIIQLCESNYTHTISAPTDIWNITKTSSIKTKNHERQGAQIEYDPNNKKTINNEERSPQIGLAHELTHAFDADEGLLEPVSVEIPGVKGVPINELKAIKMENKIRKKFNEKKRNTYKETIIPENILGE